MSLTRVYDDDGSIPGITIEKVSGDPGSGGNLSGKGNARYKITWSGEFTLTAKQAAATKGHTISEHKGVIFAWETGSSGWGIPFDIRIPVSSGT